MSELVRDQAVIHGSPDAIWALLEDPAALARVLPGAESIVATGDGSFHGVLASKLQFLTIRADVDAVFREADPPRHLRLEMAGRPRGLAGSFTVSVPFDLSGMVASSPAGSSATATEVNYAVDLQVTGRLASFGAPLLRDTLRRQVAVLLANVDRELAERRERGAR
ncbi:MAG TPA: SRPBCC domain-containing protein [Candidatus Bathyarchaeia archaeon]|nr:SRPBCC domain-containing protein [Candidatus Bathyarchaeia archaeon]